jgi:predicted acylesterase/phospholipase RssA
MQKEATVLAMSDVRYWGDEASTTFTRDAVDSYYREADLYRAAGHQGPLPPANFLAISGGGENGAYGAGLLVGWTQAGTRPQFKAVTGISTGALTAPFAFLGPAYDAKLQEVYTRTAPKDVLTQRGYITAFLQDAMADNAPLRRTVARFVDQAMLNDIAAEYAKGRVLLVATTNLDARRPVIWNVTKLAASGHPRALELIRDVLVASAAIPGAFPPVMIDVEANGKSYQEMHVDGGASAQVFVYPPSLNVRELSRERGITRERHLYVLRNARLDPEWAEVERWTFSIMGRAITSLIQTQGVGDLYRIYLTSQRDGLDFNLAYIPPSFDVPLNEPFEPAYMQALFQLGYDRALAGYSWTREPPGFTAPEVEPPPQGAQTR